MHAFYDNRVMFAGDWHGNVQWAISCIETAADNGATLIYQLGDFGIWPGLGGSEYLLCLEAVAAERDVLLVVTLGNHEDYDQVETWPITDDGFIINPEYPHIWIAQRGQVWEHSGRVVASLGGAFSIDKGTRRPHKSWWPQEEITLENVETLRENLAGRRVDLFLSHDFPFGVQPGPHTVFALPKDLEDESHRQRAVLRRAVNIAKPELLIHGHWHMPMMGKLVGSDYETIVWGLDADGANANVIIADFEALFMDNRIEST